MDKGSPQRTIYISGLGGNANKGLGEYLKLVDPNRIGLSVNKTFLNLPFLQQVAVVRNLIDEFDSSNTGVIANSYGAYLVLHALIDAPRYQSRIMLLSPALGGSMNQESLVYVRQPSTNRFEQALADKEITKPRYIELHIGAKDAGYDQEKFAKLDVALGFDQFQVHAKEEHNMDKRLVQKLVHQFLVNSA